jgi:hypothetical protein
MFILGLVNIKNKNFAIILVADDIKSVSATVLSTWSLYCKGLFIFNKFCILSLTHDFHQVHYLGESI